MSWYVSYYLGYKTKEGKIYPLYPFDSFGHLRPIVEKSRSFASDLWEMFDRVTLEETTEELNKQFLSGDIYAFHHDEGKEEPPWCFWLDPDELPVGSFIKKGYFLQDDISAYERHDNSWDGFYHMLTVDEYLRKMESEIKFGKQAPKKDIEGNECECYSCGDYAYYAYPDYDSKEYEAFMIREAIDAVSYASDLPEGCKIIILQTNG